MIFDYLNRLERDLYNMKSDTYFVNLNMVEKRNAKECIRVLSNTMRTENEYLTKSSPLELLYDIARDDEGRPGKSHRKPSSCEYIALFRGITGKAGKHTRGQDLFHTLGRQGSGNNPLGPARRAGRSDPKVFPALPDGPRPRR